MLKSLMADKQDSQSALSTLAEQFELASQAYARVHAIARDDDWFLLKLQEEVGELTQAWLRHTNRKRRTNSDEPSERDLADELADVLGHVLLIAQRQSLDLNAAIARKWRFVPDV
jgi:NTP pyrophosphatase (non-canonical NTP hydrolase)